MTTEQLCEPDKLPGPSRNGSLVRYCIPRRYFCGSYLPPQGGISVALLPPPPGISVALPFLPLLSLLNHHVSILMFVVI